jgi:hypothetical protein
MLHTHGTCMRSWGWGLIANAPPTPSPLLHAAIARKVNDFLACEVEDPESYEARHADKMDKWLQKLEHQLQSAIPLTPPPDRPDAELVLSWGHQVCEEALQQVNTSMANMGALSYNVAARVQDAIIVSFVTGCHIPPCRLNLIESWLHPSVVDVMKCQDKDCRRVNCLGNRFEIDQLLGSDEEASDVEEVSEVEPPWHFNYNETTIISHVVHGKNEFRGSGVDLQYMLPRGTLTKLILAHINDGHRLLTQETGGNPSLFVTKTAKSFANAPPLFTQFWKRIMDQCPIAARHCLPYFPPNAGRRIFVEGYTSRTGCDPEFWDGAALVMGTSLSRWEASYNPSRKRRLAQVAVDQHCQYIDNMFGAPINLDLS